jgi:cell division protein FtsI/penicillin-binding protein 2
MTQSVSEQVIKVERAQLRRTRIFFIVLSVFGSIVLGRLFYKAVVSHNYYFSLAKEQRLEQRALPAKRGDILVEENGSLYPLATTVTLDAVMIIPNQVSDPKAVAKGLAPILGRKEADLLALMDTNSLYIPPLAHKLSAQQSDQIKKLKLDGVMVYPENWRYYPEGPLAANVLGFVDAEGHGRYGLEEYFDQILRGKPGRIKVERDTGGQPISIAPNEISESVPGDSIVITLDRAIQNAVEERLRDALQRYGGVSGSVTVVDPKTGKILAMASMPSFDPNNYGDVKDSSQYINQAISGAYEPGSVFKPIVMGAALDSGAVTPETTETFGASVKIGEYEIWTAIKQAYGRENMTQVLENSDNVAMVWVAQKLGVDNLYRYLEAMGFGKLTGIELAHESSGILKPKKNLAEIDLATTSFGQGISVTPLQLTMALAAFANDGKLTQPHILDRIIRKNGKEEKVVPKVIRRVVSSQTARQISEMLVSVVVNGHGYQAQVPGYNVGGKTGTAQIPRDYGYDPWHTIGSFGGYAPIEDPRFAMLVRLDEPKMYWAEFSAAPLFGDVAKWLLPYLGVPPSK